MADVVHLSAPDFTQAAATVAQHLETAATPPRAVAPPPIAASPVDAAAAGAAGAIQTKVNTLSTQLAPRGPEIRQAGASAAASLLAQDASNAARMPSVPSVPSPKTSRTSALDNRTFKQGPDRPPPPDPVGKLRLPDYKPGSLPGEEARAVYAQGELRMRELNEQLIKQGLSPEERAKIMFEQRNSLRTWTREIMQNRADADWLNENRPNLTWDQAMQKEISRGNQGDGIYNGIIDSSTRSNPGVNAATGINPEEPPPLPPVRPSAPIEAAPPAPPPPQPPPPEPPPPVERGGEGPMIAGGPGTPLGPQLAPPPHAHPHWLGETSIEEWEEGQHYPSPRTVNKRCFEGAAAPRESGITSAARDTVVATGNNRVMVTTGRDSQPEPTFQPFRYDATGLAGRRMRVVVDHPEDDSGQNSELPPGTTDVVAIDDTPSVFLEMRVHPIDRPEQVAFIRFDQLALYADK